MTISYGLPAVITEQTVFDRVCEHLIAQGRPAAGERHSCAYRGNDGSACAVGCLIPDDRYDEGMEGAGVGYTVLRRVPELTPVRHLLAELQRVHDSTALWNGKSAFTGHLGFDVPLLKGALRDVAERRRLVPPPIILDAVPA